MIITNGESCYYDLLQPMPPACAVHMSTADSFINSFETQCHISYGSLFVLLYWPLSMRPRRHDRFVLIGLCWLYGRVCPTLLRIRYSWKLNTMIVHGKTDLGHHDLQYQSLPPWEANALEASEFLMETLRHDFIVI